MVRVRSRVGTGEAAEVTLRDVAHAAGVSISTASRALTGTRRVRRDLAERVRDAASTLGYQPNLAARSLRTARTMDLGLTLSRLDTPAALDLVHGVGTAALDGGYQVLLTSGRGGSDAYRIALQHLLRRRVDGLMVSRPQGVQAELDAFRRQGIPVLALVARAEDVTGIPLVNVDIGPAFRDALRRLADLGHRAVAVLIADLYQGGPVPAPARVEVGGMEVRTTSLDHAVDDEAIVAQIHAERRGPRPATAFICEQRLMPAVMEALRALNLDFPRDVSLATYMDSKWLDTLMRPPLAAIHLDIAQLGETATELMVRWIETGEAPPEVTRLPIARWIERPSVGPVPPA